MVTAWIAHISESLRLAAGYHKTNDKGTGDSFDRMNKYLLPDSTDVPPGFQSPSVTPLNEVMVWTTSSEDCPGPNADIGEGNLSGDYTGPDRARITLSFGKPTPSGPGPDLVKVRN